jgi:hypothetical protein
MGDDRRPKLPDELVDELLADDPPYADLSTTSPAAKTSPARRTRPSRTFSARSNSRSAPAPSLKAIPTSILSAKTPASGNCSRGDLGSTTPQRGPPDGMRSRCSSSARLPVLAISSTGDAGHPAFRFPVCISESESPALVFPVPASPRQKTTSSRQPEWSQRDSNPRPPACKAGALPTELWPRSDGESRG